MTDPYASDEHAVAPIADGAADEVPGREIPDCRLESSSGAWVSLRELFSARRTVLYVYPATGVPGRDPAPGWDSIPGAVGCTLQSLGFRELGPEFRALGWNVVSMSAQSAHEQREFAGRVGLRHALLADASLALREALGLPGFTAGGRTLYRRLAMTVEGLRVTWVARSPAPHSPNFFSSSLKNAS